LHHHKWILDKNSFGVCKCGDERQFPKEEIRLETADMREVRKLHKLTVYDPDSWCRGSCEIRFVDLTKGK
jgi:hypothetical protein